MILKDGKILLGRRHEDPAKADSDLHGEGSWTMPGGKLEFKEGLKEAGCRETMEESSLTIKPEDLELISLSNDVVPDKHFVTIGFLCTVFSGEPKVMEPDEIVEWKWFDLNDLPSPVFMPSERIIKNYLAKKIYQEF